MLLYENKEQKLLFFLRMIGSPFKKFVSTGEINEELGVVKSREELLDSIIEIIKDDKNIILPIIGEVGQGKTHLFWALKNRLLYFNIIYLSLENVYKKFYYNTYSEFIENMGVEPLRYIANQLCNEWGALERKFGFFHVANISKVRNEALNKCCSEFDDDIALRDVINAITTHQLDPYKKIDAERWLLGELMNVRELSRLNLTSDLRNKNNAFAMLKILIENSKLGNMLFIDDFEKIISMVKPSESELYEIEEVFDRSWLYGTEDQNLPQIRTAQKTLDKILDLQKIKGIRIIITLKSLDSYEEIKKFIEEKGSEYLLHLKEPLFLLNFNEEDTLEFYKENMNLFLESLNFLEYAKDNSNDYFPLNHKVLIFIHNKAKGNPREVIKLLIKIFNEIIFSYEDLEEILKQYE